MQVLVYRTDTAGLQIVSEELHWASKETYHFFREIHIKIQSISMNHNWA